jgi:hypothetical protein
MPVLVITAHRFYQVRPPVPSPGGFPPNILNVSTSTTSAIAFDYGSYSDQSNPITITLSTGDIFLVNLPATTSTASFVGFTSTVPLSSVAFTETTLGQTNTTGVLDLIDFTEGNIVSAPEPGSMGLLAAGLVLMFSFYRRKIG